MLVSAGSPWWPRLGALPIVLAVVLVPGGLAVPRGAPATSTPTATATSPSTPVHRAYVANQGSNNVTVIDTTTNTVVGVPIPVGSSPFAVGVDPTVHRAYVANQGSANVTVIDTTTNTVAGLPIPVGNQPAGARVDAPGHRAHAP